MGKRFSELVQTQSILVPIEVETKGQAIERLIHLLHDVGELTDLDLVIECAHKRESQGSTCIGQSVAIPHTKCEYVSELCVSLGIAPKGVLWDKDTGDTCKILFFMGAPSGASGPHIQALARLARLLKTTNLRERLLEATTPEEALKAIREEEDTIVFQRDS